MVKGLKKFLFGLWFFPVFVTLTILAGFLCLLCSLFSKVAARTISGKIWGKIVLGAAFTKLEVIGQENIPKDKKGYIIFCNHRSMLDIPATALATKKPLSWVAKAALGRIPVFGWVLKRIHMLVEREGGSEAARKMISEASERLKDGEIMAIFPEGTRNRQKEPPLLPFKKGAFILAKHTQAPLLPVAIYNSGELWPSGALLPKIGTIRIMIGEPLTIKPNESLNLITQRAFDSLNSLYLQLAAADKLPLSDETLSLSAPTNALEISPADPDKTIEIPAHSPANNDEDPQNAPPQDKEKEQS
jgi:1-acyl-sn-glycerol-3-phosphate acyltransferase